MTTQTQPKRQLENYLPPEGVPIRFDLAGLGTRFGAQFVDVLLTFGGVFLLVLLVVWSGLLPGSAIYTLFLLLVFFVRIPYYIFSELVWNGRTLGKRLTKIRVISTDGRRLTPHQIAARNLMKEVEVFTPVTTLMGAAEMPGTAKWVLVLWMIAVLIIPFTNRRRQRLGDMIAGTVVVDQPKTALLPDLAKAAMPSSRGYAFHPEHLEIYGRYELQTLETILRSPPKNPEMRERVHNIAQTIIGKIGYHEKVPRNQEWEFLVDFYRYQREYLESRQLFGDARENKFHADKPDQT